MSQVGEHIASNMCFLGRETHITGQKTNVHTPLTVTWSTYVQIAVNSSTMNKNEKRHYSAASIALVNGCIACICSWLLLIYILDVG